jgi:hypothetical protein
VTQTVFVSAGAAKYVGAKISDKNGDDISADPVSMSLGTYTTPGTWVTPSVDTPQTDTSTRIVKLLVNSSTPLGAYYLWVRITDNPEIEPLRAQKVIVA